MGKNIVVLDDPIEVDIIEWAFQHPNCSALIIKENKAIHKMKIKAYALNEQGNRELDNEPYAFDDNIEYFGGVDERVLNLLGNMDEEDVMRTPYKQVIDIYEPVINESELNKEYDWETIASAYPGMYAIITDVVEEDGCIVRCRLLEIVPFSKRSETVHKYKLSGQSFDCERTTFKSFGTVDPAEFFGYDVLIINDNETLSISDAEKKFAHNKILFIIKDKTDLTDIKGYVYAVSEDNRSYNELIKLRDEMKSKGNDTIIIGSYLSGGIIGVLD